MRVKVIQPVVEKKHLLGYLPNNEYRMASGKIRRYSFHGGYPIFYVLNDDAMCCDCADECEEQLDSAEVNWEADLSCGVCEQDIEAAYE